MSTSIDDILAMINGGGDATLELKDIADQTAIARALKNRQASPVMSSGRATLPNISGLLNNRADRQTGTADESRLASERLQIQSADANRARDAIQPSIQKLSGVTAIDNVDGSPSTPIVGSDPAALDEFNLLQAATQGAPAKEGQQTLQKYALARALQQQRNAGHMAGGGTSADQQWIDKYLDDNPGTDWTQGAEALRKWKETFAPQMVGGGMVNVGNRPGPGGLPRAAGRNPGAPEVPASGNVVLSDLPTEADAAAKLAAAKGEGTTVGTTEAQRALDTRKAKAMVDGMVATAQNTLNKISQIKANPNLSKVTGFWGLFPNLPGGKAADVEAKLQSLTGALAIDTLQDIRRNNPTGGAVGNVSDKDMELLKNSMQSLARAQSDEQLQEALGTLQDRYSGMIYRLRQAYEGEYGKDAVRTTRPSILPPAGAPKIRKFTRDANGQLVEVQ